MVLVSAHTESIRRSRRLSRYWTTRDTALHELLAALTNQIVVVPGPSGVGKTALLSQLERMLEHDDSVAVRYIDCSIDDDATLDEAAHALAQSGAHGHHVLILDHHGAPDDHIALPDILDHLRRDPQLTIVAGTRHQTGLENPLTALEFDTHLIGPRSLTFTPVEAADVLDRNGVAWSEDALGALLDHTAGWPALVQLSASFMRHERTALTSEASSRAAVGYALDAFTDQSLQHLPFAVTDSMKLMSVAPYLTATTAEALGIGDDEGIAPLDLFHSLQDSGLVWPSSTRLVLAEPIRRRWLGEATRTQPEAVSAARAVVSRYLAREGEPLLAAQVAAEGQDWALVASILRTDGSALWMRDRERFAALLREFSAHQSTDPAIMSVLLSLDRQTSIAPDAGSRAVAALSSGIRANNASARGTDAGTRSAAASLTPADLSTRIQLLRAAGRFGMAADTAAGALTAATIDEATTDTSAARAETSEAAYQAGLAYLTTGLLRGAESLLTIAQRDATKSATRVRAQGALALTALLEGDVRRASGVVKRIFDHHDDEWLPSPWGEPARIALAWLALEDGDATTAIADASALLAEGVSPDFWAVTATTLASARLAAGEPGEALASLRALHAQFRHVPTSHFLSTRLINVRARVLIALRQARRAADLYREPFTLDEGTAAGIALGQLFTGHEHDAYVLSMKWGSRHDITPRTTLECLVVNASACVRLQHIDTATRIAQRAEVISNESGLWSPWSLVAPEWRDSVLALVSDDSRQRIMKHPSIFNASVTVPHLTKREQVVLSLLTPSSTVAEIAAALVVSPNTVKTQLQSIYRKLGVNGRAAAIRAAHSWGLIDLDLPG